MMKNRVGLANRSPNLKRLRVVTASNVIKNALGPARVHFHSSGNAYVGFEPDRVSKGNTGLMRADKQVLKAITNDFVPESAQRFPLILIAHENGKVLSAKQHNRKGVETADLQFTQVTRFFSDIAEYKAQAEGKK